MSPLLLPHRDIATSFSDEAVPGGLAGGSGAVLPPLDPRRFSSGAVGLDGARKTNSPIKGGRSAACKARHELVNTYAFGGVARQEHDRFSKLISPGSSGSSPQRPPAAAGRFGERSYEASRKANKALLNGLMTEFRNGGPPLQFKDPAEAHRELLARGGGAGGAAASSGLSPRAALGASREWDLDPKGAALVEALAGNGVPGSGTRPGTRQ